MHVLKSVVLFWHAFVNETVTFIFRREQRKIFCYIMRYTDQENKSETDKKSVVETEVGPVNEETAETEVDFRLPRGADMETNQLPKDIPIVPGAVGPEVFTPDPGQQRRLGPLSGAKPKRLRFELQIQ